MIQKQSESLETSEAVHRPPDLRKESDRGILHVGIDLGTSRSAIAGSNGIRADVGSAVGWPRDAVSRKVFRRAALFGEEALEHRLSLELLRPLDAGNLVFPELEGEAKQRQRRAAEELFAHILSLADPRPDELVYAVVGAPAQATNRNKQAILEIARAAGVDSVMVVSEPFAVAYGIDALDEAIVIDIGAGTIDICRMHGTLPETEDQVTIFKAGNFVDEELARRVSASHPEAQFTINMVKKAKERFSGVVDSADRAVVTFPVAGKPTRIDVTSELREAVSLLVPELLSGIQSLVASFDPEFQHRLRGRVIVSGGGSQIFGLQKALEEGLEEIGGGRVQLVEEPVFAGANGALKLAREMPTEYWEELQRS